MTIKNKETENIIKFLEEEKKYTDDTTFFVESHRIDAVNKFIEKMIKKLKEEEFKK